MVHDTFVTLKKCPISNLTSLFPDQKIPMRDPFPTIVHDTGTFWLIDLKRLSTVQFNRLATAISNFLGEDFGNFVQAALAAHALPIKSDWVHSIECGTEAITRLAELVDFLRITPQPLTEEAFIRFTQLHLSRWVHCKTPPALTAQYTIMSLEMGDAIETLIAFNSPEPYVIEQHVAITLFDDGKGKYIAEYIRPSDWGDPKWRCEYMEWRWEQPSKIYINYCYCWCDWELDYNSLPHMFAPYTNNILAPGKPSELCGYTHLDIFDQWDDEWGEKPPLFDQELITENP